jgi:hypothetical protein
MILYNIILTPSKYNSILELSIIILYNIILTPTNYNSLLDLEIIIPIPIIASESNFNSLIELEKNNFVQSNSHSLKLQFHSRA